MSILHLTNEWSMGIETNDNVITGCGGTHCGCDCSAYCGFDPNYYEYQGQKHYVFDYDEVFG